MSQATRSYVARASSCSASPHLSLLKLFFSRLPATCDISEHHGTTRPTSSSGSIQWKRTGVA